MIGVPNGMLRKFNEIFLNSINKMKINTLEIQKRKINN